MLVWSNNSKFKQSRQRQKNNSPPQIMLQWPWTCARISSFQASKVNSLDLTITCCCPIFMAWGFMMLQITSVMFIHEINLKEIRGWTTFPLASFVGSITRGAILNNTGKTITCLGFLFFLKTVEVRTRII